MTQLRAVVVQGGDYSPSKHGSYLYSILSFLFPVFNVLFHAVSLAVVEQTHIVLTFFFSVHVL